MSFEPGAVRPEFDPQFAFDRGFGARAARSGMAVGIAKVVRYGFVLIVHVLLMNLLEPGDFGLVRYITMVLALLNLLNEAGLSIAIVQKRELESRELGPAFTLNLGIGAVLYLLAFACAPIVADFFREPGLAILIRVGALSLPVGGAAVVHRALLERRFLYGRLSLIEALSAGAGAIVSLALAFSGFGVWSLVWGTVAFNAASTLGFFTTGPRIKGFFTGFAKAVPLFSFGAGVVVLRILYYCISNADYMFVGRLFGSAQLGMYGVAYDVVALPQMAFGAVLSGVAMSAFSRFQDDNKRLGESFLKLTLVVSILATPFLVFVGSMSSELMRAVTFLKPDDKWLPAAPLLRILAPMGLLYVFTSYPGIVWMAKGRVGLRIGWTVFALVTVIAAIFVGKPFGVTGICRALLGRSIVFFPAILFLTERVIGLKPRRYVATLVPALAAGAVMAGTLWAVSRMAPGDTLGIAVVKLCAAAALGPAVYAAVLFVGFRSAWRAATATVVQSLAGQGSGNEA